MDRSAAGGGGAETVAETGQTRLLARTFFARMFESDLMPDGLAQVQVVLWSVLLAATPTTGYSLLLAKKYAGAQFSMPLAAEFDADRAILITLSMVAMGVVGLFIWDGVFPDRRDIRMLGVLPIPTRRLIFARLAALGRVFGLFAVAISVLQSIVFALLVAGFGDPVGRFQGMAFHFLTVIAACTFVFCSLLAAQCLLLLTFGRRAAHAASMVFQVLFAVGLVQLLVFLGRIGRILRGTGGDGLPALIALPPTWFFGLYETLTGGGEAAPAASLVAVAATLGSAALAVGLYALSYSHLSRRTLEGRLPRAGRVRLPAPGRTRAPRHGFYSPLRTAIRRFAIRTLVRSRSHRMMFAIYGGIALAIVLSSAASVAMGQGGAGLWQPGVPLLSMPLTFQFFLLVGLRVIMAVPSEPKARWLFRACEAFDRGEAVTAARDAMVAIVVVPTTIFALLQGLIFWTAGAAAGHAAFCLIVGTCFSELLIARTNKLPFACTYFPGKSRVFTLWPLYILVFVQYTIILAAIESALLRHPARLAAFCLAVVALTWLLAAARRRALAAVPGLLFEEEDPDAIFEGFNLSEGLAAAPKAAVNR